MILLFNRNKHILQANPLSDKTTQHSNIPEFILLLCFTKDDFVVQENSFADYWLNITIYEIYQTYSFYYHISAQDSYFWRERLTGTYKSVDGLTFCQVI